MPGNGHASPTRASRYSAESASPAHARTGGAAQVATFPLVIRTPTRRATDWLIAGAVVAVIVIAAAIGVATQADPGTKLLAEGPPQTVEPIEPIQTPEPEPEPEPAPEPPAEPPAVTGAVETMGLVDLSTARTGVYQPGSDRDQPVTPDDTAIEAFVDEAVQWLNTNLTAARRSEEVAVTPLLGDPTPALTAMLWQADDLDSVLYRVRVGARGVPEFSEVTVRVDHGDGGFRTAGTVTFVDADGPTPVAIELLGRSVRP